MLVIQFWV